jgi:hypothetical protein
MEYVFWLIIFIVIMTGIILSQWTSTRRWPFVTKENFVVTAPIQGPPISPYDPFQYGEETQATLSGNPIIRYPVGPTPASYRQREHIGYRWNESWRPYYYKGYPEPPIWFPARDPAQPELPPDPEILRMMELPYERGDLASQGISPQGFRYFYRLNQPHQPLCSDFANHVCRDQPYPHFCFRRTYGKCIYGVL